MSIAQSKITAQGQISIPAKVRQRLGVGPGSTLTWNEEDGNLVVRRAGGVSSEDIHNALFPSGTPEIKSLEELEKGIHQHIRSKHARR